MVDDRPNYTEGLPVVRQRQCSMRKPGLELGARGFQKGEAGPPALTSCCGGSGWARLHSAQGF